MRWERYRQSTNVEDRRGMRAGPGVAIGGGGLLLLLAFALFTGQDPGVLIDILNDQTQVSVDPGAGGGGQVGAPADQLGQFSAAVLASTEDVWDVQLKRYGQQYQAPTLVLFTDAVQSGCGNAPAAVGPFYCPADRKLYLDPSFFDELDRRFGAPGDFAQAYVIAHEVGHHVQNLLGVSGTVDRIRKRSAPEEGNAASVRLELQADCFAGAWAHHANQSEMMLDPGDVEEGLRAAAAIGDDRLQRNAGGDVQPESWTHGSSAMRARWLKRGLETGDLNACNTFTAPEL